MKKSLLIFLGLIFIYINSFAGGGWASCGVSITINSGSPYIYILNDEGWTDGTWQSNLPFQGQDFGTPFSFTLNSGKANAWTDDIPGYTTSSFIMFYRVYKNGTLPGSWLQLSLSNQSYKFGNDYIFDNLGASIDILSLATAPGTNNYTLEVTMSKNQFYVGGNWNSMIPGGQANAYESTTTGFKAYFTKTVSTPPTVTTNAASSITSSGAMLNGSINANSASTAVTFEYGLTTSYGTTVTADQSPVTGSLASSVSHALSGLEPSTTYHYRVIGVNASGTTNGLDQSFTTLSPPTITSFNPLGGAVGSTITITGTNFNTTPANNVVFFGATRAMVSAASATNLTVTVPSGATYAPITILNTGTALAAYSMANFTPTFSPNKGSISNNDFAAKVDFTTGSQPYSVAIGDIDGDGKPDLVIVNSDYRYNTVSVLRNTSSGGSTSFAAEAHFVVHPRPTSVAIGDIDGDGKPDLVIVNNYNSDISILRNTSSIGNISFANGISFLVGTHPISIAIGDLDRDGKPDLAVANSDDNTVSILRNTSSGSISFAGKVDFTTGTNPQCLVIGDIDGDGKLDLVVANSFDNTVSVLRNTSSAGSIISSSFAARVSFATGNNPTSVAISDIDGDGKPDLAVVNAGDNSLSVMRNTSNSSISFASKVDFTTGSNPQCLVIGDADGDGKPDLALANSNDNSVSVLRNTSTVGSIIISSFAARVSFTTGTNPQSVAIGDIDGDGKPDLAAANYTSNTVSVLRNIQLINTWTGTTNTDWATAGNWNTNTIPTAADNVTINSVTNMPIIGNNTTALTNNLTINTGASVTISGVLTPSGTITNAGTLIVAHGGALVGNSSNVTGTVTIQQSIIGQRGWRIFANPFITDQTISTIASTNSIPISTTPNSGSGLTDSRTFVNNAWVNVASPTTTWLANTPYALFIRGLSTDLVGGTGLTYVGSAPSAFTYNVSGTLNGASVSVPQTNGNFAIVGNPYAAPINTQALTGGNTSTYYTYQITSNGLPTGTPKVISGSWMPVGGSTSNTSTTIPVLGVLAYSPTSSSSFTITPSDINTSPLPQTNLFGAESPTTQLEMVVEQNADYKDKLFVRLDAKSTSKGIDNTDLPKLYNDITNFYTITPDNNRMAIDARNALSNIALGISALTGEYNFRLAANSLPEGTTVILNDKFLNTQTALKVGDTYPFSITVDEASHGEQRFALSFSSKTMITTSDLPVSLTANVLGNIINGNQIAVQIAGAAAPVTIEIKDMMGKTIGIVNAANGIQYVNVGNSGKGMLLLQISDGKNSVIKKVMKL